MMGKPLQNSALFAEATEVSKDLIHHFYTLLSVINCGHQIDPAKFETYFYVPRSLSGSTLLVNNAGSLACISHMLSPSLALSFSALPFGGKDFLDASTHLY